MRREVELQVSSRHLSLASKVFCQCLEGLPVGGKDERTIPLSHDDFGAIQILLNIIHGWTRRVPRRMDVEVLSRVVFLIDKYEFHEAAEIFTDMWSESLRPTILQDYPQNLASCSYICWELKKTSEYFILTKKAIWEALYGFEDEDNRLPYWIISKKTPQSDLIILLTCSGEIQSRQKTILIEVFETLSKLLDRYSGSQRLCHQDMNCDLLAVGKLIRGLQTIKLYLIPELSKIKTSV